MRKFIIVLCVVAIVCIVFIGVGIWLSAGGFGKVGTIVANIGLGLAVLMAGVMIVYGVWNALKLRQEIRKSRRQ